MNLNNYFFVVTNVWLAAGMVALNAGPLFTWFLCMVCAGFNGYLMWSKKNG